MSRSLPQVNSNPPIGGRYKIICQLGEGGFGQTFLAEDIHLPGDPRCVVKQLKPRTNDANSLQMARRCFNTEAQALYKLGIHDQIPRLLAHFEENQEFYLAQEFIEGESLAKELIKGKPWTQGRAIALLQDILQVLVFVHQQQVIHRDLKPSNLMRRIRDRRIVMIDFGAVKQVGAPTIDPETGLSNLTISIGTHGYMPNEQVAGKPRFSSDVYAVGMMGIQALTGYNPRHLRDDVDGEIEWHHLASHVSRDLLKVIDRMVRYDFRDRYPSAIEALEALNHLSTWLIDPVLPWQPTYTTAEDITDDPTDIGSHAGAYIASNAESDAGLKNVIFQTTPSDFTLPDVDTTATDATELDALLNAPTEMLSMSTLAQGKLVKAVRQTTPYPVRTEPPVPPKPSLSKTPPVYIPKDWLEKTPQVKLPENRSEWLRLGINSTLIAAGIASVMAIGAFYGLSQIKQSQVGLANRGLNVSETLASEALNHSEDQAAIAIVRQADQLRLTKKYTEALTLYDQAIALKPDYVQAYWGRCDSLNGLQRPDEAIAACDNALSYDSRYAQAVYGKANAYGQQKLWQEALELYERAIQYKPDFAEAWAQRGVALQELGRANEALDALNKSIALNNSADAWAARGQTLWNLKRVDEAIVALDKALQLQPNNTAARQLRDRARQQLGR